MASNLTITFPKIVFLVQGILQLASAVKDLYWYYGMHDVEGVRLFQVSILLVFFASVTIGSAIVSFITCTTCKETKYKPIILWCIWNVLVTVLVVYQLIRIQAYEHAWSTSVVLSATLAAALGVLIFIQVCLRIFPITKDTSNFFPNMSMRIAHALVMVSGKSFTGESSSCGDEDPLVLSKDRNKDI